MNRPLGLSLLAVLGATFNLAAQNPPPPTTLNTVRTFPEIKTRAEWKERAQAIREQILVSCGLWPLPEKTPLRANVFGRIERDGYSVEKVYFQTYPGVYLAGNLYRPLGRGKGPFPGILNPHGHWSNGRMADTTEGSIAARCISFARLGMVAFSYDMVGYNDTRFPEMPVDGKFYERHWMLATNRTDLLWNLSLMGLQTWNSIRALDFLESLPDVDRKRLACTGASGGGTQTFMLGAIDNRLAVQAPIVMVSSTMQGGCLCENVAGLRVEYSNMEIAAAAAPRPQILVAASGDWTKKTLEVEGPAIENIYRLFGEADRLRYVRFDFDHNYNQTSREAVYEWFGQWLLKHRDPHSLKEQPYQKEPDAELRVFPDGKLPADAVTMKTFIETRQQAQRDHWQESLPTNRRSFKKFQAALLPAWRHTMQVSWPKPALDAPPDVLDELNVSGLGNTPLKKTTVVLVEAGTDSAPHKPLAEQIASQERVRVLTIHLDAPGTHRNEFTNFFTTYNRTALQERVGRLTAVCAALRKASGTQRIVLVGRGRAGISALLAAPAADAVVADCDGLDVSSDATLLEAGLFAPGLRCIGTFEGGAMLAAPHPLLLHNTGSNFPTSGIRSAYQATQGEKKLRVESNRVSDEEILAWLSKL